MAQLGSTHSNMLPGIVTDQPEIFESEPALSDDTGISDSNNEPTDEAIALIEVPVKQAFSYFAERENEIAKFYAQRYGEYKIAPSNKPEEETDIEKYHRLRCEVAELLNKFRADKVSKSEMSAIGSLDSKALTNNLESMGKQLEAIAFAAEDGSLNPTEFEVDKIKSRLERLGEKVMITDENKILDSGSGIAPDEATKFRISALDRRLNLLESLIGHGDQKAQVLFKTTKCENLNDAVETLSSWLSLYNPEAAQKVSRELDFFVQQLEKIDEQITSSEAESKLDTNSKKKLNQLYELITTTNNHRGMVPTIIHRLNTMEELQRKAHHVATTVNRLEAIQSEIVSSLESNNDELNALKEMFATNIEAIKQFSSDIDNRITAIRDRDR